METSPCTCVVVPRLTASPLSLECREHTTLNIGNNRVVIGEVLSLWIRDEFADTTKFYVDSATLDLIGRMGGAGGYTEARQPFGMRRISFEQWCNADHNSR